MKIYSLVYESKMKGSLSSIEFQQLMHSSYINNYISDITGVLILHKNKFVQIIEGEYSKIKSLFSKIEVDDRHYAVKLLAEGFIEKRSFDDWFMAYYNPSIRNKTFTTENELKKYLLDFLSKDNVTNKVTKAFYYKIMEIFGIQDQNPI